MAKYSTGGGSGGGDGGTCELCGSASDTLTDANIAGASLAVCRSCAPLDDRGPQQSRDSSRQGNERDDSGRRAAQQAAKLADASSNDPDYWLEHGTEYERDRTPYLSSGYDDIVRDARQEAGQTIEELADEADVEIEDIEAIEQGRAIRAGVGGSVIQRLEEALDIELTDE